MRKVRTFQVGHEQYDKVVKQIRSVLEANEEIVFSFLHGSFLDMSFFRDIDVAVFVRELDISDFIDYELNLSLRLEGAIEFPFPIEVKVINEAPLSFCYHVIRGKLLVSKDNDFLADYMVRTAREYLDFAPVRHHYLKVAMS